MRWAQALVLLLLVATPAYALFGAPAVGPPTGRVIAERACYDTDGTDTFTKGTVKLTGDTKLYTDTCSGNNVIEYYCDNAAVASKTASCTNGCKEGACLRAACVELGGAGPNPSLGPSDPNTGAVCCAGLLMTTPKEVYDEACNHVRVGYGQTCIKCGDGVCDPKYESRCNCPKDCTSGLEQCASDADCRELVCPDGGFIHEQCIVGKCTLKAQCSSCGNGICEQTEKVCSRICKGCPFGATSTEDCGCTQTCQYTCPKDCGTTDACGNGICEAGEATVCSPCPIETACTMDAKACPDGSYVGRVAPSCEFAPCPGDTTSGGQSQPTQAIVQPATTTCTPSCALGTCPQDCGEARTCGNGICEPQETVTICPACVAGKQCPPCEKSGTSCPQDCGTTCGNGVCESGEADACPRCYYETPPCLAPCTAGTCPQDCGTIGTIRCDDATSCPEGYACKEQACVSACARDGEKYSSVFAEYPSTCCEGLTEWSSGMDTRKVENGRCVETGLVAGSPVGTCIRCGDGLCKMPENLCNCPADCLATCGNGICDSLETSTACPEDCRTLCTNGVQDTGETGVDCGGSCPACPDIECETQCIDSRRCEGSDAIVSTYCTSYTLRDGQCVVSGGGQSSERRIPGGCATNQECQGCLYNSRCVPVGTRAEAGYCDVDYTAKPTKGSAAACLNDYECVSNLCVDSQCVDEGLIRRMFAWFARMFGMD